MDFLKRIDCYKLSYVSLDEEKDRYTAAKVHLFNKILLFITSDYYKNI